ncbi:MAG: hypothetical protein ACPF95_03070 [Flavobacteriaceae bacterium]
MKRILLISICILGLGVYAQEEETTKVEIVNQFEEVEVLEKNEIRLNALDLIVHPAIGLSYERLVNQTNGYGVSVFANFGDDDTTYQNFNVIPYYRFYFLNRKDYGASGLFVEVFSSFSSVNFYDYWYGNGNKDKNEFQFSMGVGLGKKWVNRNGFTFEAFAGVGRYFIDRDTDNYSHPEAHGRIGLSIGKRF